MVVSAFGPGASSSLGRTLAAAAAAGGNTTPGPRRGRRPRALSPSEVSAALSAASRKSPFVGEAPASNMKDWRDLGPEVCVVVAAAALLRCWLVGLAAISRNLGSLLRCMVEQR